MKHRILTLAAALLLAGATVIGLSACNDNATETETDTETVTETETETSAATDTETETESETETETETETAGGLNVKMSDLNEMMQPIFGGNIINTNGCGDAFLAAAADSYLAGYPVSEIAKRGQAASALCARSNSAVSPDMSAENLSGILNR